MNITQHIKIILFLAIATCSFHLTAYSFNPPKHTISYWNWDAINCNDLNFPTGFLWGAATTAHHIEGNCINNTWALHNEQKNNTEHSDIAFDHWNHYKEDIEILKELGLNTYRFTVEWSKVEPYKGHFDQAAINHYRDVCKELIAQSIQPIITLYYDTEPIWFAYLGSFEKKENIEHFVHFCTTIFNQLNEYNPLWITFNAPDCIATKKYLYGTVPPGKKNDYTLTVTTLYHMLLAHTQVRAAIKTLPNGNNVRVGIIKNIYQIEPWNQWNILDNIYTTFIQRLVDDSFYRYFTTGIFKVELPQFRMRQPKNSSARGSLDFIGLNYYSRGFMHHFNIKAHPDEIKTDNPHHTLYPEGFYKALKELSTRLAKPLHIPIYVTENGIATHDEKKRSLFFKRYLYALSRAIKDGCDVRGYIVWSLMDTSSNEQYGLIPVHKPTLLRGEPRHGAAHFFNVVEKFSIN